MNRISQFVSALHPSYFAMVMATGIVSIGSGALKMRAIAIGLFWLNLVLYAGLWLSTLARLIRHRDRFLADLADHNRSVGFFTTVAGTCVLGNQFVLVVSQPAIAKGLWFFGIALWAVLTYAIFTIMTVKPQKPSLAEGINGGWLVAVVAAQSVSVLGGLLATHFESSRDLVLFFALVMWLGGGMLYIWIIALIFYRYTFFPLDAAHLSPPYWINMGAMAISTLAGCVLIINAEHSPLLVDLLPFVKGFTLFFWSTATWWIPMLLILGYWRHVSMRFPLRYDPLYWGAVFPLGMYTVCTIRLSQGLNLPFLMVVPEYFIYAALAAWLLAFVGFITSFFPKPKPAETAKRQA
jgi:tellurite resistance protein TehA-like permease